MKITPGRAGSFEAPIISGVKSRAGTCAPSRALNVISAGSAHFTLVHASLVEVDTRRSSAPGAFDIRYTSGGRLLYEKTSPTVVSSGDTSVAWAPGRVVRRVRAPPST